MLTLAGQATGNFFILVEKQKIIKQNKNTRHLGPFKGYFVCPSEVKQKKKMLTT